MSGRMWTRPIASGFGKLWSKGHNGGRISGFLMRRGAPSTCRATGVIGAAARPRVHAAMPSSAISRHAIIASERSAR